MYSKYLKSFFIVNLLTLLDCFSLNEKIGNFGFLGTWSATTYNGVTGTGPAGVGNPELQWERTRGAHD